MRCPVCNNEFIHKFDPKGGTHAEYECPCGQLLQWDYQIPKTNRPGKITVGPPKPCEHDDLKKEIRGHHTYFLTE